MSRPDVTIVSAGPIVAGGPLVLDITIDAPDELEIDGILLAVRGRQGWEVSAGRSSVTFRATHPDEVFGLAGPGTLHGVKRFRHRSELPATMAPSHRVHPAWATLEIELRIEKRWRDATTKFELDVSMPPVVVEPRPLLVKTQVTAPDKPVIEVGLASSRVVPGGVLHGSLAVFHIDDSKRRRIDLALVPTLELFGRGATRVRRSHPLHWAMTIPAGRAGTSVPFELPLPHGLVPSFSTQSHQLSWSLRAVVDSWLGLSQAAIEIPIEIVAGSPADRAELTPHVADQRVVDLLASLAGWQLAGLAVTRMLDDASLEIGYDYRGEHGTFVVAKIHHPPLGLELSVVPSSTLRSLFVKDVEVDIAAWDRRHHVMVRSPDQALPMLQAVVPVLADQTALGTLVRWTDDEIVFEQGVIDLDRELLAAIATSLERVATAITAGIALVAPPIAVDLEAWRELARWLDGDLVLGDLSIHGELDGVRVQLGLVFDRQATPIGVHVEVGEPRDGDAQPFAGEIADAIDLVIAPGIASATLAEIDPVRTRILVETLRGVVAERGGPYR